MLEFNRTFPHIELATTEGARVRLGRMLRNGTLDVAIVVGNGFFSDFEHLPLWSERILVILPKDHSLAERETLYWTDLRNETVLLSQYDPGREISDLLNSKLVHPADRPKITNHEVSRGAIKALVSMRMGIGLVLESDLGASLPSPLYRELRDGMGPSLLSFAAFWQSDNANPALAALLKLLRERYPSPFAEA